jgi:hypothetical protein
MVKLFDHTRRGLMWAKSDKGWGLIRPDGSWQIDPRFDDVGPSESELTPIAIDHVWGFADASGRIVIEPKFELALPFSGRFAGVRSNGQFGLIDRTGTWVVEPKYERIWHDAHFPQSWWWVKNGDKYGLTDASGELLLTSQFDQTPTVCADGRIIGIVDKKARMFASGGHLIDLPEGELFGPASCRELYVVKIGDKFGYADAALRLVLPTKFDVAHEFVNGLAVVKLVGKYGLLKRDGTWAIDPEFEAIDLPRDGVVLAKFGGKAGMLNAETGAWIVPPRFDRMCHCGVATMAIIEDKRGYLDKTGAWLIEPKYDRLGLIQGRTDSGQARRQMGRHRPCRNSRARCQVR